jgi:hypothetical protein
MGEGGERGIDRAQTIGPNCSMTHSPDKIEYNCRYFIMSFRKQIGEYKFGKNCFYTLRSTMSHRPSTNSSSLKITAAYYTVIMTYSRRRVSLAALPTAYEVQENPRKNTELCALLYVMLRSLILKAVLAGAELFKGSHRIIFLQPPRPLLNPILHKFTLSVFSGYLKGQCQEIFCCRFISQLKAHRLLYTIGHTFPKIYADRGVTGGKFAYWYSLIL